jgi:hypothetical protein
MASLDNVLRQLRDEHNHAQSEVQKLEKAISAIEGLSRGSGVAANGTRRTRTMSAAARRRIAQAQKARWAKLRKASKPAATASTSGGIRRRRPRLSAEGRKRIAAAAKARWARARAQQSKKAA